MESGIKISVILLTVFLLASCDEPNNKTAVTTPVQSQLIPVQQGASGSINVVAYNTNKDFKPEGSFVIEFHDVKSGENVKVSNVMLSAVLQIDGKKITREASLIPSDTTGRYRVDYNLPMKGMWYFNLGFNDSLSVQFIFSVI